ncbi:MAG: phosphoribosylanthranilate isomerase [Proteobacteria bacterium]|nr:phosphoribosylanthranilate isomerase [Pseudomonadota bacterium]
MSVLVKICGLTDSVDVSAVINAGADAIGFVFAESVRQVSVERALEISRHVPKHMRRVAVMLHPAQEEWQLVAKGFSPDVLQTDAADFDYLEVADNIERWPVYRESQDMDVERMPDTFVYEGTRSGQGKTVDWQAASLLAATKKMILGGGLAPHNVAAAIRQVCPFGVDVSSAVEASPGRKDAEKIAAFVAAAKSVEFQ